MNKILVYEWGWVSLGKQDNGVEFKKSHLNALAIYEQQTQTNFFRTYFNKIRFNEHVGVIKVGDLTIEVLPKTDKHELEKAEWQKVLLDMLLISLQVEANTTTHANIQVRQHSVLETYLQLFLDEAEKLIHQGLVKKYRANISNQPALKGKLLVHQQITKNPIHAERFFVAHSVYDRDNVYNFILRAALECIVHIGSNGISRDAQAMLLFFPECNPRAVNEELFQRLTYDRKTEGYKQAIELARIILLNYHPDIRGGRNDILAIMFDMNYLWESFIYWSLKRAAAREGNVTVKAQSRQLFWRHEDNWNLKLKPDLVVTIKEEVTRQIVVDTKWKYQSRVTIQDVRQLYTYLHYFDSIQGYLLYPDKIKEGVSIRIGKFYIPGNPKIKDSMYSCGLMFADLIIRNADGSTILNKDIGNAIIARISMT